MEPSFSGSVTIKVRAETCFNVESDYLETKIDVVPETTPLSPATVLSAPVWTSLYVLSGYFLGIAFIEYFNYVLIGFILVITIYTVYKDPMNLRKEIKND